MTNFYFFSPTTMNEFLNEAKAGAKAWLVKAGTSLAVILLVVIGARVYSSSKSAESVIDNPTEEAITFKLDGKDLYPRAKNFSGDQAFQGRAHPRVSWRNDQIYQESS